MKTLYAACLARIGLTLAEAGRLHGVPLDTIKHWSSGRRTVPDGIWAELRSYEAEIVDRSEAVRESWADGLAASGGEPLTEIPIGYDGDARTLMALADFVLATEDVPARLISLAVRRPN